MKLMSNISPDRLPSLVTKHMCHMTKLSVLDMKILNAN